MKLCPTCGKEWPDSALFCGDDATPLPSPETEGLTGRTIGRYRILDRLGGGGMGTVYVAEHLKLHRKDAIKVLNSTWADQGDALARFHREARNASTISHPNVCAVYDFGETPEGLTFLAMELVDGKSLAEILKEDGALSPARAAELTRQVAEALTAAHAKGIVHRDLKPGNIMVTRAPDGAEMVKVVDFGIAKAAGGLEDQEVTRVGLVAGTPEYMSPEHLRGDEPDPRSDVYSLGVVFYRMLTGRLPFGKGHTGLKPMPLVNARPDGRFPDALQAVLDRALEYDALSRYPTARELGTAAVAATGAAVPEATVVSPAGAVPAAGTGAPGRVSRRAPWQSPLVLGGGALVVATLVGVGLWIAGGGDGGVLAIQPAPTQIRTGASQTLALTRDGAPLATDEVRWSSADPEVATVDAATGLLTGRGIGSTRIVGYAADDSTALTVQVLPGAATRVAFGRESLALRLGESATVRATTYDAGSNPLSDQLPTLTAEGNAATVDASGRVVAIAPGDGRIVAQVATDGGALADTLPVRVRTGAVVGGTDPPEDRPSTDPSTDPSTPSTDTGPDPAAAEETLSRLFRSVLGADAAAARAYRDTASVYWGMGARLDDRHRGMAAFIAGQASDLLGEEARARTWWCRAESMGLDTRRDDLECS